MGEIAEDDGEPPFICPFCNCASESRVRLRAEIRSSIQESQDRLEQRLNVWMARQEKLVEHLTSQWAKGASGQNYSVSTNPDAAENSPRPSFPPKSARRLSATIGSNSSFSLDDEDHMRKQCARAISEPKQISERAPSKRSGFADAPRAAIKSNHFEMIFTFAILSNSALIGIEVQYMASDVGADIPIAFYGLHFGYALLFLVELLLRMWASGRHFFNGKQWAWNAIDVFIVASSILEAGLDIIYLSGSSEFGSVANISNVRIVRLIRITRLIRTLRIPNMIRFVTALRTLVDSILITLRSLIWTMVLLLLIIYVFGIVFAQRVSDHRRDTDVSEDPRLVTFWGDLFVSMFTLFKTISGGVSWHECVEPLEEISAFMAVLFSVFVFFTYFAVLNVVTGIFCHSAIETSHRNPDLIVHTLMANKHAYIKNIHDLFHKIDTDESGEITITELEKILTSDVLQAYFAALDLDAADAWTLFKLIDRKRNHSICLHDFIEGCTRLKGNATGMDIATIMADSRWLTKKMSRFMRYVETQFDLLFSSLQTVQTTDHLLSELSDSMSPKLEL